MFLVQNKFAWWFLVLSVVISPSYSGCEPSTKCTLKRFWTSAGHPDGWKISKKYFLKWEHKKSWFRGIKKVVKSYGIKYKARGTNLHDRKKSHKAYNMWNFGDLGCQSCVSGVWAFGQFIIKTSSKSIRFSRNFRFCLQLCQALIFVSENIFWIGKKFWKA